MECTGVNKVSKTLIFQPVAACGCLSWHNAGCCLVCVSEPAGRSVCFHAGRVLSALGGAHTS